MPRLLLTLLLLVFLLLLFYMLLNFLFRLGIRSIERTQLRCHDLPFLIWVMAVCALILDLTRSRRDRYIVASTVINVLDTVDGMVEGGSSKLDSRTMPLVPPRLLLQTFFPNRSHDVGAPDNLSPPTGNSSAYAGNNSIYTGNTSDDIATPESRYSWRPHVTLTFAQSIDAKIAGQGGKQLALSGRESLVMTHWMRTMHDAILVGIGTALNDDPQLNTRHLPTMPPISGHEHKWHLPRPIILDAHLRLSPTCKLLKNYNSGNGRKPWIFASRPKDADELKKWFVRKEALKSAGARVYAVAATDGYISLSDFLKTLKTLGVRSLMVEGGARVIQSFLKETQPGLDGKAVPIVDNIIITIAPTLVGADGVGYECDLTTQLGQLEHIKTEIFGRDAVMAFKFKVD